MPPWHADPQYGKFVGERRLTDAQKSTIAKWVAAGAPEGNAADLACPAGLHRRLEHQRPTWCCRCRRTIRFRPPARCLPVLGGPRELRRRSLHLRLGVSARRPSCRAPHAPVFEGAEGSGRGADEAAAADDAAAGCSAPHAADARRGSAATGAAVRVCLLCRDSRGTERRTPLPPEQQKDPGPNYRPRPRRHGARAWAASRRADRSATSPREWACAFRRAIRWCSRCTTPRMARRPRTASKIGLKFAKTPPKTVLNTMALINALAVDSSGRGEYTVDNEMTFNRDTMIYSLIPHTHVRGKGWHYEAIYPDGRKEVVLSVPKYDFNWQHDYVFTQPLQLPAGTKLHAKAWYDNSTAEQVEPGSDQDGDVGRSDVGGDDVHQHHLLPAAGAAGHRRPEMIGALLALLLGGQTGAQQGTCAALSTLQLPDVRIADATAVAAPATGVVRVAHCKVTTPYYGADIRFSLLLPDDWNRKFMMGGGGGFVAGIDNQARGVGQCRLRDRRHRYRPPGRA